MRWCLRVPHRWQSGQTAEASSASGNELDDDRRCPFTGILGLHGRHRSFSSCIRQRQLSPATGPCLPPLSYRSPTIGYTTIEGLHTNQQYIIHSLCVSFFCDTAAATKSVTVSIRSFKYRRGFGDDTRQRQFGPGNCSPWPSCTSKSLTIDNDSQYDLRTGCAQQRGSVTRMAELTANYYHNETGNRPRPDYWLLHGVRPSYMLSHALTY
jgi:hypothetical protein